MQKTGGYIAGKKDLIELVSYRLTSPGIGESAAHRLDKILISIRDFILRRMLLHKV